MQYLKLCTFLLALIVLLGCESGTKTNQTTSTKAAKTYAAFIGTYSKKEGHVDGKGEGIYLYQLDSATGYLDKIGAQNRITNPSFLTLSADGKYLYAVEEIGSDVDTSGHVIAYRRKGGFLEKINQQPTFGFAPCHVSTDSKGRYVFVANYAGGIAGYHVGKNGQLEIAFHAKYSGNGTHPRQDASHPHSVNLSPDDQYLYVPDLGTDDIHIYKMNYEKPHINISSVGRTKLHPGSGPRHFTFHPTMPKAYVVNELSCTVTLMDWDKSTGKLDTVQSISTLPADFKGNNNCSDLHITPNGQFLYAANRGHNSIVGYSIDPNTGALSLIGHAPTQGEVPRNFAISPDGRFLYAANQNSDNIVILSIGTDGKLKYRKEEKVFTPVCIQFK